jgi:tripartite-type tricarboxylate transporter receptor subunit TctC
MEADRLRWVPSQGGAPALQDVAAGGITAFTGSPIEAKALLEAGKVRTIVLMAEERPPTFPDIPTTKELGIDWTYQNWFALAAPKGIPQDRREKLYAAAQRAMARPDVQDAMRNRGITPVWDKPGEFAAYVGTFVSRGTEVLKDLGLAK